MNARPWVLPAITLLLALDARAVAPQQDAGRGQQTPSFRSGVTAVPIDVRVVGKDGQPIADLKKEDFTILENGVPQTIAHFSAQILVADAPRPGLRARPDVQPFDPSPQSHRVFLIVMGSSALGDPRSHPETLNALIHFVRDSLLPQDQVALLAYNRATDFTADHEKIARLLESFRRSEAGARAALARQGNLAAADAGSVFASPESLDKSPSLETELGFEEYVKARGSQPLGELDSLFYGIKYLRYMGGEKHLIFVTERGPEPTWDQVKYLTSLASDARVALDTIQLGDRVGDLPSAPLLQSQRAQAPVGPGALPAVDPSSERARGTGGARGGGDGGAGRVEAGAGGGGRSGIPVGSAVFDWSPIPGFKGLYDLRYVAGQTGGQASILKDAAPALGRIDTATRAHYLLAYYPSNGDWNGRFRSVTVKVNRPDVTVLFRHGYYARRDVEVFDRRRVIANSRIESAGYLLSDIRDIGLTFAPSFTKSATDRGGEVLVPLSIDVTRLGWSLDADGRHVASLEIGIFCGDAGGKILGEARRILNLALIDETYERALKEGFSRAMRVAVTAAPHFVKVIVYDYDADRVGSALVKVPR
jgi:VWFA-related protein